MLSRAVAFSCGFEVSKLVFYAQSASAIEESELLPGEVQNRPWKC